MLSLSAERPNISIIAPAVNNCPKLTFEIFDKIQDEIVTPVDIITIVNDTMAACFIDKFNLAILSNANDITQIAAERPITDKKLIFPTNLKAIPIANTATAISKMVVTPFLIAPSFLAPPASSTSSVFLPESLDFFLERAIIVC